MLLLCFRFQGEDDYMNSLGLYDGYDSYNDSGQTTEEDDSYDATFVPPGYSHTKGSSANKRAHLNGKDEMGEPLCLNLGICKAPFPLLALGAESRVCYLGNTADRQTQRGALTYYHLWQSTANQNRK
jgi:hypothetical protein